MLDSGVGPPAPQVGAPRRLPVVPLTGTRESLPSWINRIGLLYGVRQPDILACLGLTARGEIRPATAGLALAPSSLNALSAATGVSAETIGGMLLSRFAATALPNLPSPPYLRPLAAVRTLRDADDRARDAGQEPGRRERRPPRRGRRGTIPSHRRGCRGVRHAAQGRGPGHPGRPRRVAWLPQLVDQDRTRAHLGVPLTNVS
ncbi:TniQ family protein [Streptomyces sp. NPDC023998]|uniref:TniQ family protein n=1 Tax=Streptomyces sp. NPDC023998 TaxID=3154597 RepID=UPI0033E1EF72